MGDHAKRRQEITAPFGDFEVGGVWGGGACAWSISVQKMSRRGKPHSPFVSRLPFKQDLRQPVAMRGSQEEIHLGKECRKLLSIALDHASGHNEAFAGARRFAFRHLQNTLDPFFHGT